MGLELPDPIVTYFDISNGVGTTALARCFDTDAVVSDEHQTHKGLEAIQRWLDEAKRKYRYAAEPIDALAQGSAIVVRARVSGNFPGSPTELDHTFHLVDNRIASLEIG